MTNPLAPALRRARRALATTLPTVETLFELSASHSCLMLLRSLNTSDILGACSYMLLDADTCRDIARMCDDMLKGDAIDDEPHPLTPAEIDEYNAHIRALLDYANRDA